MESARTSRVGVMLKRAGMNAEKCTSRPARLSLNNGGRTLIRRYVGLSDLLKTPFRINLQIG